MTAVTKSVVPLLLLVFGHIYAYGQTPQKIDTIFLKTQLKQINAGINSPPDSTRKRIRNFLKNIESFRNDHKEHDKNLIDSLEDVSMTQLIHVYNMPGKVDSSRYYGKIVLKKTQSTLVKAMSNYYLGRIELENKNYDKSLVYYQDALQNYRTMGSNKGEVIILLNLSRLYQSTENFELSKKIDSTLKAKLERDEVPIYQKGNVLLNLANRHVAKGEFEESIKLLKTADLKELKQANFYSYSRFCFGLSYAYLNTKQLDSAYKYAQEAYSNPKFDLKRNIATKSILFGSIFVEKKDYAMAKKYIDEAKKHIKKYASTQDLKNLCSISIEVNTNLKNYTEVIEDYEEYIAINDSINKKLYNRKSEGLMYKLEKDNELIRLNEAGRVKDLLLKKDRQLYISIIITITVLLLIVAIFINYYRKKKSYQISLQLEKAQEIALIKNTFLENMAHEVRTPLTVILGYLGLSKKNTLKPKRVIDYANSAQKISHDLINSFNNFLTLLRADSKPEELSSTRGNISGCIKEMVLSFKGQAILKEQKLYYKTNMTQEVLVEYDFDSLKKIVSNLISNAIKYTNSNKSIFVSTILIENEIQIVVRDEGIGVEEEELDLIFNRFYQSKNHLTSGGFGIGLSLVSNLTKSLGGTIKIESKSGVGSIFYVHLPLELSNLPLYISEGNKDFQCLTDEESEATNLEESNLPRALIVDDNLNMISYLKELLSPMLSCDFAYDGLEGLNKAKAKEYDIIISDLRMPKMNGLQFKQELDKLEVYGEIPFIMLTASTSEYSERIKEQNGLSEYILKPFVGYEIKKRIGYLLENRIYTKKVKNLNGNSIDFNGNYSELLEKIRQIIVENLSNSEFKIKQLAQACGYGEKQLGRILKSKVGMTPVKLILEIRLLNSYDLIMKNKYKTLNEVIYAVGLNSRTYFNKVFKERFGIMPKELMEKLN